jgi:hypothetical protein
VQGREDRPHSFFSILGALSGRCSREGGMAQMLQPAQAQVSQGGFFLRGLQGSEVANSVSSFEILWAAQPGR